MHNISNGKPVKYKLALQSVKYISKLLKKSVKYD